MNHLRQVLDTGDDSFSYFLHGEAKPKYIVDCNGRLYEDLELVGAYKLRDDRWHLYIGDQLIESSAPNTTFGLPEFELASLTRLINR